jgi:hypothetical protein
VLGSLTLSAPKVRARAELVAELEEMEQREPTSPEIAAALARALGLPRRAVIKALKTRTRRDSGVSLRAAL